MVDPLPLTWYIESPIDLEHKQYILFAYLQKVEMSFINRILSPHLLHMEKMLMEMKNYENSIDVFKKEIDKNRYIYLFKEDNLEYENNELINEIQEIVNFSIPQVKSRISFGYKVLEKNRQILY